VGGKWRLELTGDRAMRVRASSRCTLLQEK